MLKITGYRVINGHTVTHISRKRRYVHSEQQVKAFEAKTASRYQKKSDGPCEAWAIITNLSKNAHNADDRQQ